MCGLIASTGKIEARYSVALGCLAESRGDQSAGVAWAVKGQVRIAKLAQNPLVAFPVTLAPAIRHAAKYGSCLIGHTRQATTGAVNHDNAHPFYDAETNIAWAHNGMIYNHGEFGSYAVDSEALIHGIKNRDFEPYRGPIALVWIENGELHAFRKGNPLHRGYRNEAVYLASEEDMLKEIGCKRVRELSEGFVYHWQGATLVDTKRVACSKVHGYRPPVYTGPTRWTSEYDEGYPVIRNIGRSDDIVAPGNHSCDTLCAGDRHKDAPTRRELIANPVDECFYCRETKVLNVSGVCYECNQKNWGRGDYAE